MVAIATNRRFEGFCLSISVSDEAEASPRFGMLEDRFGVGWMVSIPGDPNASK